jgi:hypothetical protein
MKRYALTASTPTTETSVCTICKSSRSFPSSRWKTHAGAWLRPRVCYLRGSSLLPPGDRKGRPYSLRKLSTGFASAAFTLKKLTVTKAMAIAPAPATANIHHCISMR